MIYLVFLFGLSRNLEKAFWCVGSAGAFFIALIIQIKGVFTMDNYKEMYLILFNAITDAIKILEDAQKKAEEIFINQ